MSVTHRLSDDVDVAFTTEITDEFDAFLAGRTCKPLFDIAALCE